MSKYHLLQIKNIIISIELNFFSYYRKIVIFILQKYNIKKFYIRKKHKLHIIFRNHYTNQYKN